MVKGNKQLFGQGAISHRVARVDKSHELEDLGVVSFRNKHCRHPQGDVEVAGDEYQLVDEH